MMLPSRSSGSTFRMVTRDASSPGRVLYRQTWPATKLDISTSTTRVAVQRRHLLGEADCSGSCAALDARLPGAPVRDRGSRQDPDVGADVQAPGREKGLGLLRVEETRSCRSKPEWVG